MSDTKKITIKPRKTPLERFLDHPSVRAEKKHKSLRAFELLWEESAQMNRLTKAICMQACNDMFSIFGEYDPLCSYCNPFLGGEIRREPPLAPQPACLTYGQCASVPWTLTKEIYKAIDEAKEEMTFQQIGDGRDVTYEDTINSIRENISFESLDIVLTNHGKDIGWLEEREAEFKIWLGFFYYPFENWDSDYSLIEDNYIGSIHLEETENSLPY